MGSLTLLAFCSLAASAPTVAGIQAEVDSALADVVLDIRQQPADQTDWQGLTRNLVRLKAGDRLTAAGLEEALAALAASNRFENIHADTVVTPAGPVLTFSLTPFRRIRAIHIENAAPLFARDIRNRLSIHAGGPFPEGSLAAQTSAIETLYRGRRASSRRGSRRKPAWTRLTVSTRYVLLSTRGSGSVWGAFPSRATTPFPQTVETSHARLAGRPARGQRSAFHRKRPDRRRSAPDRPLPRPRLRRLPDHPAAHP